jgi:GDPmannose 4,6-dehydratase
MIRTIFSVIVMTVGLLAKAIMKNKALIIGISGQDGAYLAKLLLDKGYEVHGSSRDHELTTFRNLELLGIKQNVTLHSLALSDFRSVFSVLDKVRPHELYNLAGQSSVGLSFAFPVETFESISVGTLNVLECMRMLKLDLRFYNAGSSEVFGNTPHGAKEDTLFRPRSPYATAKAAAHYSVTNYREAYDLFCCTGILFNHESPLRPARFVTKKIVSAAVRIKKGSPEKLELGRLDIKRDWGWAPEYVEAMWLMLQQGEPDDFVIATGVTTSLEEYVTQVFRHLDLNWKEFVTFSPALRRPSDIDISFGRAAKANVKLNWNATVPFSETVARMVDEECRLSDSSRP